MKKMNTLLAILSLAAVSLAFAVTNSPAKDAAKAGVQASEQTQTVVTERLDAGSPQAIASPDAHADACKWNRDNCLKGCDGATSCSNQCWVNYNKCMDQNK